MLKGWSVRGIISWEGTEGFVMCLSQRLFLFPAWGWEWITVSTSPQQCFSETSAHSALSLLKAAAERTANISAIGALELLMQRSFQGFLLLPGN